MPKVMGYFFQEDPFFVRGVRHAIITARTQPARLEELKRFVMLMIIKGFTMDQQQYDLPTSIELPECGTVETTDVCPHLLSGAVDLEAKKSEFVKETFLQRLHFDFTHSGS